MHFLLDKKVATSFFITKSKSKSLAQIPHVKIAFEGDVQFAELY